MIMSMEDKNLIFGKSESWCPYKLLFCPPVIVSLWRDIQDFALPYIRNLILSPISFLKEISNISPRLATTGDKKQQQIIGAPACALSKN